MKNEESVGTMNEKETPCDKSLQEKNDSSFFTLHSSFRKLRTIEMNRLSVEDFKHAVKWPLLYLSALLWLSIEEFKQADKLPLIVVLDDVRSLYNVGSVFRTSDAFRVEAIYLCGITATPPSTEIHKTALGAEDSVEWKYFKTANEAVEELHRNGYFVYSVEQAEGSTKLNELNEECRMKNEESPRENDSSFFILHSSLKKFAVVFGNEVKGVHQSVIDMSDACLEIPQFGTKHSMNVSVTAGIVIWEFAKRFI